MAEATRESVHRHTDTNETVSNVDNDNKKSFSNFLMIVLILCLLNRYLATLRTLKFCIKFRHTVNDLCYFLGFHFCLSFDEHAQKFHCQGELGKLGQRLLDS